MKIISVYMLVIIFSGLVIGGCSNNNSITEKPAETHVTSTDQFDDGPALKIYVGHDGHVTANGVETPIKRLNGLIDSLPTTVKAIYYSRYNAEAYEGPKESIEVIDIIAKHGLPIRFYTDSTFTKVAGIN